MFIRHSWSRYLAYTNPASGHVRRCNVMLRLVFAQRTVNSPDIARGLSKEVPLTGTSGSSGFPWRGEVNDRVEPLLVFRRAGGVIFHGERSLSAGRDFYVALYMSPRPPFSVRKTLWKSQMTPAIRFSFPPEGSNWRIGRKEGRTARKGPRKRSRDRWSSLGRSSSVHRHAGYTPTSIPGILSKTGFRRPGDNLCGWTPRKRGMTSDRSVIPLRFLRGKGVAHEWEGWTTRE